MPRLKLSDLDTNGLYLGGSFSTLLPPTEAFEKQLTNPIASKLYGAAGLADRLQREGTMLMRSTLARVGTTIGVPTDFVPDLRNAVAAVVEGDPEQIAFEGAKVFLDIYLEAMGAVPFVGVLARLGLAIVEGVLQAQEDGVPLQPALTYNSVINADKTQELMHAIGEPGSVSVDWTPIFRPTSVAPWVVDDEREGVWGFRPDDGDDADGWGVVPGIPRSTLEIWAHSDPTSFAVAKDAKAGGNAGPYRFGTEWVYDETRFYPSYVRAGMSAWEAVQTRTAAMFNVDTRGLSAEWHQYGAGFFARRDAAMGDALTTDYASAAEVAAYFAAFGMYDVPTYAEKVGRFAEYDGGGKPTWPLPPGVEGATLSDARRLDAIAATELVKLRRRQTDALDTLLCAYCSEHQPAFRDPALHMRLMLRRTQLLKHPSLANVELDDVPDDDFRAEISAALSSPQFGIGGLQAHAPVGSPAFPGPDGAPGGSPWDVPEGESGGVGAGAIIATGLGIAGVWGVYKLIRSRARR